jgi:serine/threonine-protein kinase
LDQPLPTGPYDAQVTVPPSDRSGWTTEARFSSGAVLAGRYRIVALLGQGGMGEVYRADDLTLGQPVALKFLPAHLARDPDRLTRFRKEVATARKVSHPNVCRVYDIAEHDSQPFLSMEFIDGEDLASVLRRFGRLPEERAIEAARQLCAGLAAVHEQGLLHRDLKPANVMFDGRGKARLTDFGLAVAAQDLGASDIGSGTPMYMAPEQLAGLEVSVRSDLFALGLVLYELFTGKRAFVAADRDELARKYAQETPSKPSSHVSGLNAAVERTILGCLEREPAARPKSAYEVLAALPGGDPLAAALAAGETPSPQLVADAGGEGTISARLGAALLGVVVAAVVVAFATANATALYRQVPVPQPPSEMARDARKMLADLGYSDKPADWVGYYSTDGESLVKINDTGPGWENKVRSGAYPTIVYTYREATRSIVPGVIVNQAPAQVSWDNPPRFDPGMAGLRLDPRGRLLEMYAVPPRHGSDEPPAPEAAWQPKLFAAAGLDFGKFKDHPAKPQWISPCVSDEHYAWTGVSPDGADVDIRVEAAAYRGKPVYFQIIGPWTPTKPPFSETAAAILWLVVVHAVMVIVVLLALRNLWRRRADVGTAARLIGTLLVAMLLVWILAGHHTFYPPAEVMQVYAAVGWAGWTALVLGFGYLAMEPAIRRRWPWQITAWNRLFAGRWRDPMVGRDALIGLSTGCALFAIHQVVRFIGESAGYPSFVEIVPRSRAFTIPLHATLAGEIIDFVGPMFYLMVAFLLFLVVRRTWLAWVAMVVLFLSLTAAGGIFSFASWNNIVACIDFVSFWIVTSIVLSRFGLLAGVFYYFGQGMLLSFPLTLDTSAWYFWEGLCGPAAVLAVAGFAFVTATRGQRLFAGGFLGDD